MPATIAEDNNGYPSPHIGLDIATGAITGYVGVHKFGAATIGASEVTIWDGANDYPFPSSASQLDVQSDDVNDTSDGTGARTVTIQGLDSNWSSIEETLSLNGTTPVITSASFLRVFRAWVNTAGSGSTAAGEITIENTGVVIAKILVGNNQTLMCVYTIEAGCTGYTMGAHASVDSGKSVELTFKVRDNSITDSVFRSKEIIQLYQTNTHTAPFVPTILPEKTDIKIQGLASGAGTAIGVSFNLILVPNAYLR